MFENMVAINFINLDNARACEVLEARNAVGEFMLTNRKISKAEHFRFIESLRNNKNNAYFAVYEKDKNAESSLDSADFADSALSTNEANSTIADEFLGFCEASDKDKTKVYRGSEPKQSLKSRCESEFALDSTQNLRGVICFNSIDLASKNAFFGIYSKGKNNGAKLLQILRFIAFEGLNLHILYAKVLSTNAHAIRFYEKNGFVRCGGLPEALKRNDKFIDLEIWALKNNAK